MQQRGITLLGFLISLSLVAFLFLMGMRLVPLYYQHYTVTSAMNSLKDLPLAASHDRHELRQQIESTLLNRFQVNDITQVDTKKLIITTNKEGYLVSLNYTLQTHLIANIDALLHFHNSVVVPYRDQ